MTSVESGSVPDVKPGSLPGSVPLVNTDLDDWEAKWDQMSAQDFPDQLRELIAVEAELSAMINRPGE